MMHRTSHTRGFTLLEVMVSVALLMIVSTALWRTMAMTFNTKTEVEQLNDRFHEARQITARIAKEMRMAFLRSDLPDPFLEEDPSMVTRFLGTEDEVAFATTAHLPLQAGARESDQAEVAYFLRSGGHDSPYDGKTLYRRESKRIDNKPDRGGSTWAVVDGVKEFQLEYWDDSKEIGDDAWTRTWDSDDNSLLPARIRITLVLERQNGGKPVRFVTQAQPRIRRPIDPLNRANQLTGRGDKAGGI